MTEAKPQKSDEREKQWSTPDECLAYLKQKYGPEQTFKLFSELLLEGEEK